MFLGFSLENLPRNFTVGDPFCGVFFVFFFLFLVTSYFYLCLFSMTSLAERFFYLFHILDKFFSNFNLFIGET